MKQMLKDFSNLLLMVLCDYVLGEAEYLLLGQPGHVALSNSTVSVDFQYFDGANGTLRNVSVLLLEANTNQTVTTKYLLTNQSQGTLEFECFYFKEAGDYWFTMTLEATNSSTPGPWREQSAFLKVEWPVFHIDLNRTSKGAEGTFQVGLFTSQPLCPFPVDKPDILVDVIFTNSLPEARLSQGRPQEIRASKRAELSQGQWVEFGCASVGPRAFVTIVLKLLGRDSVITSAGPIDLAQKFGYKLVMAPELMCESGVEVMVLPPPCIFVQGVIAVFKEAPRRPGERTVRLAENSLTLGERRTVFNCTLFDMGRNKYCFDFGVSSRSQFSAKEEECMLIQRNIETWGLWQPWSQCSATCGDGVRERRRLCLTSFPSRPGCPGMSSETSPCSLEECAAFRPSSQSPLQPQGPVKSNNIVTVTGISLCLFIIVATVLITLWRKFGRAPKCSTPARHNSLHGPGCRKNSDEENICELSEAGGSPTTSSHPRSSHFRRTASFHEAKQARPFRERSLSTLTPRQAPACGSRTHTWDQAEDRFRPPSRGAALFPEKLDHGQGASGTGGALSPLPKSHTLGQHTRKPDLGDRQAGFVAGGERTEPHRARRGPSPSHRSISRKQPSPTAPKDSYQRVSPLSPSQCRKDKCQSFPAHPEFAFYDNTSFGLTEAEQRMLDLPGYFGSNEEDETTSTLSVEKLVI
uniref:Thrombospondin type-1 domain-containing protein 1 n=1 Tax=Camelus bactrianus TaxID=9837 RepID=A0A9W3G061_CAMBA|nr:thrombospondin type-1 domain-containing protein 1 [Camelus bactrianus]